MEKFILDDIDVVMLQRASRLVDVAKCFGLSTAPAMEAVRAVWRVMAGKYGFIAETVKFPDTAIMNVITATGVDEK